MGVNDFFKPAAQRSAKPASSGPEPAKRACVPWVEKYRPRKVDELVFQDEVVAVLKKCIKGADLPNLLFYGPPGTGKTSAAVALCHQFFPTLELYKSRVLEMNASDERGIDVVRHRIKDFAHLAVSENASKCRAAVALKVVILDEADAMTIPAQSALRRTMESESHTTRFFLICNYVTRIIEPLTSRCAKFHFKPLTTDAQRQRLLYICEKEGVNIDANAIIALVEISGGDLRKSINTLQSLASVHSATAGGSTISTEVAGDSAKSPAVSALISGSISVQRVRDAAGYVPDDKINELLAVAQSGNVRQLVTFAKSFCALGYSEYQAFSQLADLLLDNEALEARHKARIFEKLGECEKRLLDGADEFLELLDFLMVVYKCFFALDTS